MRKFLFMVTMVASLWGMLAYNYPQQVAGAQMISSEVMMGIVGQCGHKVGAGVACTDVADECTGICVLYLGSCNDDTFYAKCPEEVASTCETGLPNKNCVHYNIQCEEKVDKGDCECTDLILPGIICSRSEPDPEDKHLCSGNNKHVAYDDDNPAS